MSEARKKAVLFICTHNAARSQMAEAFLNSLYGDRYKAYSAGTQPTEVSPYAIQVMGEMGIDIFLGMELDYVVTVCDHVAETCPFFPRGQAVHPPRIREPLRVQWQ